MSHTWHKVLCAERRDRILMHASPLCQDDGSELYLCKDLTQSVRGEREQEGEKGKQLLFFPQYPDACHHVSDK